MPYKMCFHHMLLECPRGRSVKEVLIFYSHLPVAVKS